jgi:phage shock protein PspC (stress-responsive transcriptional regulator)
MVRGGAQGQAGSMTEHPSDGRPRSELPPAAQQPTAPLPPGGTPPPPGGTPPPPGGTPGGGQSSGGDGGHGAGYGTPPPGGSGTDRLFAGLRGIDVRRTDDGWIGGVCAGLAHRLGLDPIVVRAGAVVLGIVLGLGLALYLLAWLLVPDTREQTHLERGLRGGEAGSIVLLVATAVVLVGSLPWWGFMTFDAPGSGLVSLLVVAGLAWALWSVWQRRSAPGEVGRTGSMPVVAMAPSAGAGGGSQTRSPATGTASTYAAPPPPPGATGGYDPSRPVPTGGTGFGGSGYGGYGQGGGPGGPPQPGGPTPAPPSPSHLRRRSPGAVGGLIVSGLLLMVVGGLIWAADTVNLAGNTLSVALAAGLLLVGLVLVGLGLVGRRAGFVGFLAWVTLVAAALTAPFPSSFTWGDRGGDVTWSPTQVSELRDYSLGAGTAELTLENLDPADLNGQRIDVDLGAGELRIVVPRGLDVTVNSDVGAGEVTLEGDGRGSSVEGGLGVSEQTVLGDLPSQLEIEANVGLGTITIVQE